MKDLLKKIIGNHSEASWNFGALFKDGQPAAGAYYRRWRFLSVFSKKKSISLVSSFFLNIQLVLSTCSTRVGGHLIGSLGDSCPCLSMNFRDMNPKHCTSIQEASTGARDWLEVDKYPYWDIIDHHHLLIGETE